MPSRGDSRLKSGWLGVSETKSSRRDGPQPAVIPPAGSHHPRVWGSHLASLHPSLHCSPKPFLSCSRLVMDLILWLERGQFYLSSAPHLHNDLHKSLHFTPRPTLFLVSSFLSFCIKGVLLWLIYLFLFSSCSLFLSYSCQLSYVQYCHIPANRQHSRNMTCGTGEFYAVIIQKYPSKKILHLHATDEISYICHANRNLSVNWG